MVSLLSAVVVLITLVSNICFALAKYENPSFPYLDQESTGLNQKNCGLTPYRRRHLNRISNGYKARVGEFPSFVSLRILKSYGTSKCGGTIIGPQVVLTAAHCLEEALEIQAAATIIGPNRWKHDESLFIKARKFCIAPNYLRSMTEVPPVHDLGVIILERPFALNQTVQTACLPDRDLDQNETVFAVGIGRTDVRLGKLDNKDLQAIPMRKVACQGPSRIVHTCLESQGVEFVGSKCKGDSGGPSYVTRNKKAYLVGITSYGSKECLPNLRYSSTDVNVFRELKNIRRLIDSCLKESNQQHSRRVNLTWWLNLSKLFS